jgi:hypothetical protein
MTHYTTVSDCYYAPYYSYRCRYICLLHLTTLMNSQNLIFLLLNVFSLHSIYFVHTLQIFYLEINHQPGSKSYALGNILNDVVECGTKMCLKCPYFRLLFVVSKFSLTVQLYYGHAHNQPLYQHLYLPASSLVNFTAATLSLAS